MRKVVRISFRLSHSPHPSGKTMCVAVVSLLCLTLTASALAWRQPTRNERRAITQTATHTLTSPAHKKVHVSKIRVSTVGPWASAQIAVYFGNVPDIATDILHKVHGKWRNASDGTAGEWCVMPRKDRRNLGFDVVGYVCTG
jgi:hypothetical protein